MTPAYQSAKKIALGITQELNQVEHTDNIWDISPSISETIQLETPFQFFEKEFEAPQAILAHKAALSLFDEYETDRQIALETLKNLSTSLRCRDATAIKNLLADMPLSEWLSYVFIEDNEIDKILICALKETDLECRHIFCSGVRMALDRLITFKGLFNEILDKFGGSE